MKKVATQVIYIITNEWNICAFCEGQEALDQILCRWDACKWEAQMMTIQFKMTI